MFKLTYPRFALLLALVGAVIFGIQKLLGKNQRPWL